MKKGLLLLIETGNLQIFNNMHAEIKKVKMLIIGFKRLRVSSGMSSHIILMNFLKGIIIKSKLLFYLNYNPHFINHLLQDNLMIFKQLSNKYKLIIIKEVEELDSLDALSYMIDESTMSHYRTCVDRNGFIFIVCDKNKLIFRACVQRGKYLAPIIGNAFIKIAESDYYIEACETHIKYRGQRIYPWVLSEIRKELLKKKDNNLYIATDVENVSSRKGIERAGFKLKETYVLLNIFLITYKLYEIVYFGKSKLIQLTWMHAKR